MIDFWGLKNREFEPGKLIPQRRKEKIKSGDAGRGEITDCFLILFFSRG